MREPLRIGISLGQLGNFQDGLGEFCRQLGERLAAQAPALRERHGIELVFHLREAFQGCFGDQVGYLAVNRWQRWRHRPTQRFALWHSLHQLNKTLPPHGTPQHLVTVHDLNFFYFKRGYSFWRDLRRTQALMRRSQHLVAISDYVRKDVQQRLAWTGPIEVIYNGARNLVGTPQQAIAALAGRRFLFHLSRMSPSKNVGVLIELARHWPDMHFVLAGPDGGDTRAVRDRLAAHPLPNVTVLLSISDAQKAWLYAHCAGFLFPSLTEGFGLPPIEAMHFGTPVFLSNRTCLPEIGGPQAGYFDDFSPASMRAVVEQGLARSPGRQAAIAEHAARFDWDRCAADYLGLYARLLGLSDASRRP